MVMNTKKTKTMIFSRMRKTDVEPFIRLEDEKVVEYTNNTKLLGVVINKKLSTWDNTKYIESKAYRCIWIIKRLGSLGCGRDDLVMTYVRIVRSVCEFDY